MTDLLRHKLKVFISSSMREENGTTWMTVRQSIKSKLMECEYLEPFTIESHATELSSSDFFLWQVTECDLIVILVKNEIRDGTEQEIELAIKRNKPILVYFYETDSLSDKVKEFRDYLGTRDKTTYKSFSDFEKLPGEVYNDVSNNLIYYYKYSHDRSNNNQKEVPFSTEEIFEESILDNRILDFFGNNQNQIIENFELDAYTPFKRENDNINPIGVKLLDWLYNGNYSLTSEDFDLIREENVLQENYFEIFKLRQKSIFKYESNDLDEALELLEQAFEIAEDNNAPKWLLGDILIDSRNIYNKVDPFNNIYQTKIDELDYFINFPIADRYISQALETLEDERYNLKALSPGATRFGNTLLVSLQNIENYLYTSFLIGSSTHLLLARSRMIEILLGYGEIYEDINLVYQAIKLMLLSGDSKKFYDIVNIYWGEMSTILPVKVDELWITADRGKSPNSKIMKCLIIQTLGQYMNNALFRSATVFLLQMSTEIHTEEQATKIIDAINYNSKRLKVEYIIDIVINILGSNKIYSFDKVTNLLTKIDLTGLEEHDLDRFSNALSDNINKILNDNGEPHFIINLMKQNESKFVELYNLIRDQISEDEFTEIEYEMGTDSNVEQIIKDNIQNLEQRFSPNSFIFTYYSKDPLSIITNLIKEHASDSLLELLNKDFMPLVIKVLSSETSLAVKQSYLKSLVILLVEYKRNSKELPPDLRDLFLLKKVELKNEFNLIEASYISARYYLNTIILFLEIETDEILFSNCIDYKEKSSIDRDAFSFSIQKYIEFKVISNSEISSFIQLVALEMLRDEYYIVRKKALKSLMLLYNNNPNNFLKGELIRMTLEASTNVKGYFCYLLKENTIEEKLKEELLNLLSKDANFIIRENSLSILEEGT